MQIFWLFRNFQDFQLKLWDLYLPKGTIVMANFCTTNTNFQALQDRIHFGRFRDTCVFLGETPWNRPSGIITFFAITQEGVDQSFSSSSLDRNIDKTVLCTKFHHNRISLWRVIVYTDGHSDGFYSVLTFWVHKNNQNIQIGNWEPPFDNLRCLSIL